MEEEEDGKQMWIKICTECNDSDKTGRKGKINAAAASLGA